MYYMNPEILNQSRFMRLVKAARAILGWSQNDLSRVTGISLSTLNRLERGDGESNISTLNEIYRSFADAGIKFMDPNDGGLGVMLTKEGLIRLEELERGRLRKIGGEVDDR